MADTIKIVDVAKSLFFRYLSGDGSVSQVIKLKIEQVIQKTKYMPISLAQSLKAKVINLVWDVIPRIDSYTALRTMTGIDYR
jgi:LacI family sucrose operon transcriptional repressor